MMYSAKAALLIGWSYHSPRSPQRKKESDPPFASAKLPFINIEFAISVIVIHPSLLLLSNPSYDFFSILTHSIPRSRNNL
jgi:hypothetical protein